MHSPFAFRFVREVLTQPYEYYCYPSLDAAARSCRRSPAAIRCLFRIALAARGPVDVVDPDAAADAAVGEALRRGCSSAGESPFRVALGRDSRSRLASEWSAMERGMLFESPGLTVVVADDRLPHQCFSIVF